MKLSLQHDKDLLKPLTKEDWERAAQWHEHEGNRIRGYGSCGDGSFDYRVRKTESNNHLWAAALMRST